MVGAEHPLLVGQQYLTQTQRGAGITRLTGPVGNAIEARQGARIDGYANENTYRTTIAIEQLSDREIRVSERVEGAASVTLEQVFDLHWNPIEVLKDGNSMVKFSPRMPVFDFPLEIGKTWGRHYYWTSTVPKKRFGETRVDATVIGWEEVTVPAGTFNALKVDLKSPHYAGEKSRRIFEEKELMGGVLELYWYAPDVKRFVKYEARSV